MPLDPQPSLSGPGAGADAREKSSSCLTLIGPSREDKHSLAKQLAVRLHWDWIDTDHLLEAWFGRTLNAIKKKLGLSAFLKAQDQVLLELNVACLVITAGSGAALSPNVLRFLRRRGKIVFLRSAEGKEEQQIREDFVQGFCPKPDVSEQPLLHAQNCRLPESVDFILPGPYSPEYASKVIVKNLYGQQTATIKASQAF